VDRPAADPGKGAIMMSAQGKYKTAWMAAAIFTILGQWVPVTRTGHGGGSMGVNMTIHNQTGHQLFLDELHLLQSRSRLSTKDSLIGFAIWNTFQEAFEENRRSYDVSLVNLLIKYDLCPDNIYNELDRLWDDAVEKGRQAFMRFSYTTVPCVTATTSSMFEGWNHYIREAAQFAKELAEAQR
jgi:hypothetical protein